MVESLQTSSESRPKISNSAVSNEVAQLLLPTVLHWYKQGGGESIGDEELRVDLAKALNSAYTWDGYSLAKNLEHYGWDGIDSEIVNILDSADHFKYKIQSRLEKEWVQRTQIKPLKSLGERCSDGGVIVDINTNKAKYTINYESLNHKPFTIKNGVPVFEEGSGTRGLIKNFEDVDVV